MKFCALLSMMAISAFTLSSLKALAEDAPAPEKKDSKALYKLWETIKTPKPGEPHAIGAYQAGCIVGAHSLPITGKGYQVMKLSRLRYFGHPELVNFIEKLAERTNAQKMPDLLIGDLGRPRGGPMISGHASHQVGLDVDIWFLTSSKKLTNAQRESTKAPSYVFDNKKLKSNWKAAQTLMVQEAAQFDDVERIFVNPAIKKMFCEKFPDAPWLYKLRAWWGHADHFHVRMRCPPNSDQCHKQDPLDPKETQCGKDLAWWFSDEAREEWKKKQKEISEREFPDLPAVCDSMPQN